MLWELVSDPAHLPRWWPNVTRVEDVQAGAWTTVMATGSGRPVRADYTLLVLRSARSACPGSRSSRSPRSSVC